MISYFILITVTVLSRVQVDDLCCGLNGSDVFWKVKHHTGHSYLLFYLFAGFDNTCDMSAVLGILANASVFPAYIQTNAKDVRSKVRNEWGHCNFDHWTETAYNYCFQLMETLVRSLGLPKADEDKELDDLHDWETKG